MTEAQVIDLIANEAQQAGGDVVRVSSTRIDINEDLIVEASDGKIYLISADYESPVQTREFADLGLVSMAAEHVRRALGV